MPNGWRLTLDRRLFVGLGCGSAMFVAALMPAPPPRPRPDFGAVHHVEGRLFCTNYVARGGSDFRIDDVHYVNFGGGNCTHAVHGFDGPRVQASWVQLPGSPPRRALMTVREVETGKQVLNLTPADVERVMSATEDPYVGLKLVLAMVGGIVVVASMTTAVARGRAQRRFTRPISAAIRGTERGL